MYKRQLSKFAEQEGKLAGEFYTPSCVVRTLVEVLQPFNGRVYEDVYKRQAGGAYVTATGADIKVDDFERLITMQDGTKIPMDDILSLSLIHI